MEKKTFKIPEGYVFDPEKSNLERGIIAYKKKMKFSKNWDEFCKNYPVSTYEYYISTKGDIRIDMNSDRESDCITNLPSRELAEAMIALCQLLTIREKEYTKGWEPDWTDNTTKAVISYNCNKLGVLIYMSAHSVLSFPDKDLAEKFLETWSDLLRIAKPLI